MASAPVVRLCAAGSAIGVMWRLCAQHHLHVMAFKLGTEDHLIDDGSDVYHATRLSLYVAVFTDVPMVGEWGNHGVVIDTNARSAIPGLHRG